MMSEVVWEGASQRSFAEASSTPAIRFPCDGFCYSQNVYQSGSIFYVSPPFRSSPSSLLPPLHPQVTGYRFVDMLGRRQVYLSAMPLSLSRTKHGYKAKSWFRIGFDSAQCSLRGDPQCALIPWVNLRKNRESWSMIQGCRIAGIRGWPASAWQSYTVDDARSVGRMACYTAKDAR
jgi:hypothetical protein